MQDRYVGDIGDFGKYGLLRWLTGMRENVAKDGLGKLQLGVVWWMNNEDKDTGHGGVIGYLSKSQRNDSKFRVCDPCLYLHLKQLVFTDNREVWAVQRRGILPHDTPFFDEELPHFRCVKKDYARVRNDRKSWLKRACKKMAGASLIFVDPDVGINFLNKNTSDPKYVTMNELKKLSRYDKSLVLYQSFGHKKHCEQIASWVKQLKKQFNESNILVLRFGTIYPRALIVVMQGDLKPTIEKRIRCFARSKWNEHFVLHGENGKPIGQGSCKP